MKKRKIKLKELQVMSFTTSAQTKGGTIVGTGDDSLNPFFCTVWCKTGPTCPECASPPVTFDFC